MMNSRKPVNEETNLPEGAKVIVMADIIREHHGLKATGSETFSAEEVMALLEKVHGQYNNGSSI
jgi:hypothetical protein